MSPLSPPPPDSYFDHLRPARPQGGAKIYKGLTILGLNCVLPWGKIPSITQLLQGVSRMKKSTAAKLLGIAAAGAGAAGSLLALGNVLYKIGVARLAPPLERTDRYPSQQAGREWARLGEGFRTVTIRSADGLTLWASVIPARESDHRWALCMHGYRDSAESMGVIARHYSDEGWNVLLPDQRGHGRSEGDYVGWGFDERLDVVGWVNYIVRRDPEAQIVLHGVSLGAASVLMATGGALPRQVKAAVSDCAYTTIEAEMKHILDRRSRQSLSIPVSIPFSFLFAALRKTTLRRAGYDLRDVAPIEAVARSRTPTLFIHGVCDRVVPPAMMGKLYQAARCPKRFLWVQDADHTDSVGADPVLYWKTVDTFLADYMD